MRTIITLFAVLFFMACQPDSPKPTTERVLRHVVMFKFKDGTTEVPVVTDDSAVVDVQHRRGTVVDDAAVGDARVRI